MSDHLTFRLVTPDGIIKERDCRAVILIAADGENGEGGGSFGILPGHAPAIVALAENSAVKLKLEDGNTDVFSVSGGFAEIKNDTVTVICERVG